MASRNLKRHIPLLTLIIRSTPYVRRKLIEDAPNSFLNAVTELTKNFKRKTLTCPDKDRRRIHRRYGKVIHVLSLKSTPFWKKRHLVLKQGDFLKSLLKHFQNGGHCDASDP